MPEVGFDNKPVKYDLKTAPPDGFVMLRRLPYDEILVRREMATRMSMEQAPQRSRRNARQDRKPAGGDKPQGRTTIEIAQIKTREYEFANCITDHNLMVQGVKVDFTNPRMAFKIVPPEIMQEIELLLSELNLETDEDELEDFLNAAKPSSSSEGTQPQPNTESK